MLADDIISLITTDGLGTGGTDLFKNNMPDGPDSAAVVFETPGAGDVELFDGPLERPRFSLQVRGPRFDQDTPRLRIERITKALSARGAFTVNGTRYLAIIPIGRPAFMRKDGNDRWTFVVNFDVMKEPSSTA